VRQLNSKEERLATPPSPTGYYGGDRSSNARQSEESESVE